MKSTTSRRLLLAPLITAVALSGLISAPAFAETPTPGTTPIPEVAPTPGTLGATPTPEISPTPTTPLPPTDRDLAAKRAPKPDITFSSGVGFPVISGVHLLPNTEVYIMMFDADGTQRMLETKLPVTNGAGSFGPYRVLPKSGGAPKKRQTWSVVASVYEYLEDEDFQVGGTGETKSGGAPSVPTDDGNTGAGAKATRSGSHASDTGKKQESAGAPSELTRTGADLDGIGGGAALLALGAVTVVATRRRAKLPADPSDS